MANDIQYYNERLEKLIHPWKRKIEKLVRMGKIQKVSDDEYLCHPILGYNTRKYVMNRTTTGSFRCNCQGFNKRGDCSHIQALYIVMDDKEREKQGVFL